MYNLYFKTAINPLPANDAYMHHELPPDLNLPLCALGVSVSVFNYLESIVHQRQTVVELAKQVTPLEILETKIDPNFKPLSLEDVYCPGLQGLESSERSNVLPPVKA